MCGQMPPLPDMDPYTRNAVREQARAVATAGSVIPNAITTQVGQIGATVAQAASTLEPGLPVPQIPNAPVPEIVQVASNGINTAIKAAVTANGAVCPWTFFSGPPWPKWEGQKRMPLFWPCFLAPYILSMLCPASPHV
jgi:hypothetical protein